MTLLILLVATVENGMNKTKPFKKAVEIIYNLLDFNKLK